jgi:hypothetical protein
MLTPWAAKASAMAWPMPLVEPVTMATCPCKPKSTAIDISLRRAPSCRPGMLQCSISLAVAMGEGL